MYHFGILRLILHIGQLTTIRFVKKKYIYKSFFLQIETSQPELTHGQICEMMRRWFIEDNGDHQKFLWDRDEPTVEWLLKQVNLTVINYNIYLFKLLSSSEIF